MMRSFWIIQVAPKSNHKFHQKGQEEKIHRVEEHVRVEAETGAVQLQAKEHTKPPKAGRPRAPEGVPPAGTLILDFWPPEQGENTFLLLGPPR